jgi:hypothetical protein
MVPTIHIIISQRQLEMQQVEWPETIIARRNGKNFYPWVMWKIGLAAKSNLAVRFRTASDTPCQAFSVCLKTMAPGSTRLGFNLLPEVAFYRGTLIILARKLPSYKIMPICGAARRMLGKPTLWTSFCREPGILLVSGCE